MLSHLGTDNVFEGLEEVPAQTDPLASGSIDPEVMQVQDHEAFSNRSNMDMTNGVRVPILPIHRRARECIVFG